MKFCFPHQVWAFALILSASAQAAQVKFPTQTFRLPDGFEDELGRQVWARGGAGMQHPDRDGLLQRDVLGPVDDAHTTSADLLVHAVRAHLRITRFERIGRPIATRGVPHTTDGVQLASETVRRGSHSE